MHIWVALCIPGICPDFVILPAQRNHGGFSTQSYRTFRGSGSVDDALRLIFYKWRPCVQCHSFEGIEVCCTFLRVCRCGESCRLPWSLSTALWAAWAASCLKEDILHFSTKFYFKKNFRNSPGRQWKVDIKLPTYPYNIDSTKHIMWIQMPFYFGRLGMIRSTIHMKTICEFLLFVEKKESEPEKKSKPHWIAQVAEQRKSMLHGCCIALLFLSLLWNRQLPCLSVCRKRLWTCFSTYALEIFQWYSNGAWYTCWNCFFLSIHIMKKLGLMLLDTR